MRDKSIILRRTGFRPVVCVAVVCFQLFVFSSSVYSQTFSGGSGTQADPYKISTPADLVELSNFTNVDKGVATIGKYFVMTNNIDMANISNFVPIGITTPNWTNYYFYGNFDGKGFAIKNLTIVDSLSTIALFGKVRGASISNIILDKASFTSVYKFGGQVSAFIGDITDSLHVDNCIVLNSTLKGNGVAGFIRGSSANVSGRFNNCHVINTTIEGGLVDGFCNMGGRVTKSSVVNSTLTSTSSACGFMSYFYGDTLSECYVSNCILSINGGNGRVYGFIGSALLGEINNCGVQSLLIREQASTDSYGNNNSSGFAHLIGTQPSEIPPPPLPVSNCYDACEFICLDNIYTYDNPFVYMYYPNLALSNCYYKTDTKLGITPTIGVGKSDTELKHANMVASTNTPDVSLNYNGNAAWKADYTTYPINKGYPILGWMQRRFYVSTYHPTNINLTSATLQGLTYAEGEDIIVERGFYWQQKGTNNWKKVSVPDTTFTISNLLSGLTKNTAYEYCAYMKLATESSERYGDTVEFSTYNEHKISGKVTFVGGAPLAGVVVSCTPFASATTNIQGEYTVTVCTFSNVSLMPSLEGYSFSPPSILCSNVTTNLEGKDFFATNVGIVEANNICPIQIYPNPTTNQLQITNYELRENTVIEIYDVVGKKLVSQFTFHNSHIEIDISHLAAGLYFLKVDGKVFKVIKE